MAGRQALVSRPFKIERPEVTSRVEARPDLLGSKVVFFGTWLDGYSSALKSGKCWACACWSRDGGEAEGECHRGDLPFVRVTHLEFCSDSRQRNPGLARQISKNLVSCGGSLSEVQSADT